MATTQSSKKSRQSDRVRPRISPFTPFAFLYPEEWLRKNQSEEQKKILNGPAALEMGLALSDEHPAYQPYGRRTVIFTVGDGEVRDSKILKVIDYTRQANLRVLITGMKIQAQSFFKISGIAPDMHGEDGYEFEGYYNTRRRDGTLIFSTHKRKIEKWEPALPRL